MLRLGAASAVLAAWCGLIVVAARRLPEGMARELTSFLPDCVTMLRRLWRDPRVPLRARLTIGAAALWAISPIDPIPEFLPVIGLLDDVVIVALAIRYALRQVPPEAVREAWPGSPRVLARLVGASTVAADAPN